MAMSDYLETALLNHVCRGIAYSAPTSLYLALYTSAPTDAGGGTEVSGGGYARQPVTFGAPSNGQVTTTDAIEFPVATADWGTIVAIGVFDDETGGNLLFYGNLDASKQIFAGDQLRILAGNLTISLD